MLALVAVQDVVVVLVQVLAGAVEEAEHRKMVVHRLRVPADIHELGPVQVESRLCELVEH